MSKKMDFETIPIGLEMGPVELTLDEDTINEKIELHQWADKELMDTYHLVPPGLNIDQHAGMQFAALPDLRVGIWAKSEHEFLKPMKLGEKIFIRGRFVEKYVKRGRDYAVVEFETVDENGEVLMRSRETSVYVE